MLIPRLGRPLWVLLAGVLISHFGYYIMIPFLVVILTTGRALSISQAGLVMATMSLSNIFSSALGGPLSDRFGRRATMLVGLVLRSFGLAGYAMAATAGGLFSAAALTGLGGGFFLPAVKAGIAGRAEGGNRSAAFSLRGVAANIGTTLGPLLGALLAPSFPALIFLVAGGLHLALGLAFLTLYPTDRPLVRNADRLNRPFAALLQDRTYVAFSLLSIALWTLYTQLMITVPLRALGLGLGAATAGLLWSFSSIEVILLQVPINNLVSQRLHPLTAVAAGTGLLGLGLGAVALTRGLPDLMLAVGVFTLGEMLVMPTVDTVVSRLSPPASLGTYFGVAVLVWGAGEGIGNLAGSRLMDLARQSGQLWLPWLVFAVAGGLIAAATLVLRYWPEARRALRQGARMASAPAGAAAEGGESARATGQRTAEASEATAAQDAGTPLPPVWQLGADSTQFKPPEGNRPG